jgi:uncharacterized membrane protein YgaE (UPF0421/DUF939 family)
VRRVARFGAHVAAAIHHRRTQVVSANLRFEELKRQASEKLESAATRIRAIEERREKEAALSSLKLKQVEAQLESLREAYEQKVRENAELMQIADELLNP